MKKRLFLMLSLAIVTMAAMAVPVKPGWRTIQLADGSEVRVQAIGDEHGHWLQAADGTCYVDRDGVYVVTDRQKLQAQREARQSRRGGQKVVYASTADGLGEFGKMSLGAVPSIGQYTIPVVMVQFKNLKFKNTTTVAKMTRYYNEEGYDDDGAAGSVRDYFKEQSGGQFIPTFDVVGIVTLDNNYEYYGKNDSQGNDQNVDLLPGDVVAAAISQLGADFSQYVVPAADINHSAGVPLLAMLYAGKGEATEYPSGTNYLWPCEWDAEEDPIAGGNYGDVHFNSFFIGNELGTGGGSLMGCALFCHEFGHALGLPDFYGDFSNDDAFGYWSIMDSGAYIDDDCRIPAAYTAYEKSYMGWMNLPELDYTQDEVELCYPGDCAEGSAVIVRYSSTETFILENHQPSTFFPAQYGSGVLVTRIAYNKSSWENNEPNTSASKKRACVLTANGAKLNYSADKNNLYGYTKTSIGQLKTYSGQTKDIAVKKVTRNTDNGTITLTLNSSGPGPGPEPPTGDYAFYESFDQCNDEGGNDGVWSGQVADGEFLPDNDGWTAASDKAYGANQCAKFGTSSVAGAATTPAFTLNGTTTMTFKAGAWKASADGTTLNLSIEGGTIDPASVTMQKGDWTDYSVSVTGNGTVKITFAAQKGRFFLDEVKVQKPATTGIETMSDVRSQMSDVWYTLDGRRLTGKPTQKGIFINNGKKVVMK